MPEEILNEDVKQALRAATIVGPFVYLQREIRRETAKDAGRVLSALRGTLNRTERAYVFPGDPTPSIAAVLERGVVPPKNPLSFYATPSDVAQKLFEEGEMPAGALILEPHAGDASLAAEICRRYPHVTLHCGEIDPIRRTLLAQQGYLLVSHDFLSFFPEVLYDAIIANPPFTQSGDRLHYQKHIWHAWKHCLKPGGRLVFITPSGYTTRSEQRLFREFVSRYGAWELNGKEAFRLAGASVATTIVRMVKPLDYQEEPSPLERIVVEHVRSTSPAREATKKKGRARQPTQEELDRAETRRESVRGWLVEGSKGLFEEVHQGGDGRLRAWADVAARFAWKYSAYNILLIAFQRPEAIHLEGFSTWLKRYQHVVTRGEKGVAIQQPRPWKSEKQGGDGQTEVEEGLGFKVVSVFDVTQVEEPLGDQSGTVGSPREVADQTDEQATPLPSLPYVEPEHHAAYLMLIDKHTRLTVGGAGETTTQVERMQSCRIAFVKMLVAHYYGVEAPFPSDYQSVWSQTFAGRKDLMDELEVIRTAAARVLVAVSQEAGRTVLLREVTSLVQL